MERLKQKEVLGDATVESVASSLPKAADRSRKSPAVRVGLDPEFAPTLIRKETLRALRRLQKSTSKPYLDLKYLSEVCHQIALQAVSGEEILVQALKLARELSSRP